MANKILRIDASARTEGSVTRQLNDAVIAQLEAEGPIKVVNRDLTQPIPQLDETWVGATFTPPEERTEVQKAALAFSDELVAELAAADTLVIGLAVYNFSTPASLKAWIDQVVRVGVTFRYTETGSEGLLTGKRAIVTFASGGTQIGSDYDFATGYIRHILGFVGITEVSFVTQDDVEQTAQVAA